MSVAPTLRADRLDTLRAAGLEDLLVEHHAEVEDPRLPLAVDWPTYYALERAGVLKLFGLWAQTRLIGYAVWLLKPPLHQRGVLWGICDILYVEPAHRGRAGLTLIRGSEHLLREAGAKVLMVTVKPRKERRDLAFQRGRDSVGHLLGRLGYATFEEAWIKHV